jgi:glycosyltransferase involved in cell wall biosynthesis
MGAGIAAVINTRNEEKNLPYALRSVRPWVDEIIVVDMHSEDRTVEVARSFGARTFLHEPLGFADPARAFALEQATQPWALILDADEMVPAPLAHALKRIAAEDRADVVVVSFLNYLFGSPLLHTGYGPHQTRHPRFFKRGSVEARPTVHRFLHPAPGARVHQMESSAGLAIVHFNYLNIAHYLEKLDRYTTIEAAQARQRGERASFFRALRAAAGELVGRYLLACGYRDGWRGALVAVMMAFYRLTTQAKLKELETAGPREATEAHYRAEAERVLAEYAPSSTGQIERPTP